MKNISLPILGLIILTNLSSCNSDSDRTNILKKSYSSKELKENFTREQLLLELELRNEEGNKDYIKISDTAFGEDKSSESDIITIPDNSHAELKNYSPDTIYKAMRELEKVIYGVDDRRDIYTINDPVIIESAKKVACLFKVGDIRDNGDGTSTLITTNFGLKYTLCPEEIFYNQPSGAFCSGFGVSDSVIATAGHCLTNNNINSFRFIFGFQMKNDIVVQSIISNDDIFSPTQIIAYNNNRNSNLDFALVKVNKKIPSNRIAKLRVNGGVNVGQNVYVIGHPCGLPLKVAGGAKVRNNSNPNAFIANLDSYGGNSGSPVFDSETNIVEGILVRGETDFIIFNNECRKSRICPDNGCVGETVSRVSQFKNYLKL